MRLINSNNIIKIIIWVNNELILAINNSNNK